MTESDKKIADIERVLNKFTFSKDTSAFIVGGKGRLMNLYESGEIRGEKKGKAQNAKWYFNASDVIRFCRHD